MYPVLYSNKENFMQLDANISPKVTNTSGGALEQRRIYSSWPIFVICLSGLLFCLLTFFPGWMSPDSVAQYGDAKSGRYVDWHPVMMAWWWGKLDKLYSGPALMLTQNLCLYWGAWCLLAHSLKRRYGSIANLIPLFGFLPGTLFLLGEIWKDIFFATSMFFVWAVLINAYAQNRGLNWVERISVLLLSVFSFGVKTNGMTALPFMLYFWVYVEGWFAKSSLQRLVACITLCIAVVITATLAVPAKDIVQTSPLQYTQTYDLLAISVETGDIVLPEYITERTGTHIEALKKLYVIGSNNPLFYGTFGPIMTTDNTTLGLLNKAWITAITKHPKAYIRHRLAHFRELIRFGSPYPATTAAPVIVDNPWGFSFSANSFSQWLEKQPERHPALFFPWIYILVMLVAIIGLFIMKAHRLLVFTMGASAACFIFPHIIIAPASDFRYLYYSYFCSIFLTLLAALEIFKRTSSIYFPGKGAPLPPHVD